MQVSHSSILHCDFFFFMQTKYFKLSQDIRRLDNLEAELQTQPRRRFLTPPEGQGGGRTGKDCERGQRGAGVAARLLGVSKCVTEHFVIEPITTHSNPTRTDKGFYRPP